MILYWIVRAPHTSAARSRMHSLIIFHFITHPFANVAASHLNEGNSDRQHPAAPILTKLLTREENLLVNDIFSTWTLVILLERL